MKKITISYIILVAVLSCTATFISVRGSDNTTISTEANRDSVEFGSPDFDINLNKNKKDTTNVTTK